MKTMCIFSVCMLCCSSVLSDTFGTSTNQFTIDYVTVGNPGNTNNARGYGAVDYEYRIGKYEITIDQFIKARHADGNISNGDENFWNTGEYPELTVGTNAPASWVSWYEAAKFCNWLTSGNAYLGVYQFDGGGTLTNVNREAAMEAYGVVYVLPTADEWCKAAFYKSDGSGYTLFATGDSTPTKEVDANWGGSGGTYATPWVVGTGNIENNGTFDMNGNVHEWTESAEDGTLNVMDEWRVSWGGSYFDPFYYAMSFQTQGSSLPADESEAMGFRVAVIAQKPHIFIGLSSGEISINWSSCSGLIYQVQYSTNLASTNWIDLGDVIVGNGLTNNMADAVTTNSSKFYRVKFE